MANSSIHNFAAIVNDIIEKEIPWQLNIIEFTDKVVVNANTDFPSLIEKVESLTEDAIKEKKKEIYNDYLKSFSSCLQGIAHFKTHPHEQMHEKVTLVQLKQKVLRAIVDGYNPKLSNFKAELIDILNEYCSIVSREKEINIATEQIKRPSELLKELIIKRKIYSVFYETVHYSTLINHINGKLKEIDLNMQGSSPIEEKKKLTWKGTPAQLAFFINLLEAKDYISGLTKIGERDAKLILDIFEIKGRKTTVTSLSRNFQQLHRGDLPINPDDVEKLEKLPHRKDLKR